MEKTSTTKYLKNERIGSSPKPKKIKLLRAVCTQYNKHMRARAWCQTAFPYLHCSFRQFRNTDIWYLAYRKQLSKSVLKHFIKNPKTGHYKSNLSNLDAGVTFCAIFCHSASKCEQKDTFLWPTGGYKKYVCPEAYRAQFSTDFGYQTHFGNITQLSRCIFLVY